jgi:hypothetical protein
MGNALSRGGLVLHAIFGAEVEGVGVHSLIQYREELPLSEVPRLLAKLEAVSRSREAAELTFARGEAWYDEKLGWVTRVQTTMKSLTDSSYTPDELSSFAEAAKTRDAYLRLLMAHLAIRLFENDHGEAPKKLDDVVPQYLSTALEDPYCGNPLVYRRTNEGYVLYSVGPDGRDNGGRFGATATTFYSGGFDFDVDLDLYQARRNKSTE